MNSNNKPSNVNGSTGTDGFLLLLSLDDLTRIIGSKNHAIVLVVSSYELMALAPKYGVVRV